LSRNIREIHAHNAFRLSFEENHRFAYNIVLAKKGALLYDGVCTLVRENLDRLAREEVVPTFPTSADVDGADPAAQSDERTLLLKALRKVWEDHHGNMCKLRDILKYMVRSSLSCLRCARSPVHHLQDRVYTKQASVPEIMDQGLQLFLQRILAPPISTHLVSAILAEIRVERDGYTVHRSDIKGCVDVLLSLSPRSDGPTVYKSDLEPAVLQQSTEFYKAEGERLLQTCDASEYLKRVRLSTITIYTRLMYSRQRLGYLRRMTEQYTTSLLLPPLRFVRFSMISCSLRISKQFLACLHRGWT
jgi:cullin 3